MRKKKEFKDLFDNDEEKIAMTVQFQKEAKENFGISDFFIQDGKMFLKDSRKNWGREFWSWPIWLFILFGCSSWGCVGEYSYCDASKEELEM